MDERSNRMGDMDLITEEVSSPSAPVTLAGIYAPDAREPFTLTASEMSSSATFGGQVTKTFSG
jgi:hypothetical protein